MMKWVHKKEVLWRAHFFEPADAYRNGVFLLLFFFSFFFYFIFILGGVLLLFLYTYIDMSLDNQ